jgi:hypothetical protein
MQPPRNSGDTCHNMSEAIQTSTSLTALVVVSTELGGTIRPSTASSSPLILQQETWLQKHVVAKMTRSIAGTTQYSKRKSAASQSTSSMPSPLVKVAMSIVIIMAIPLAFYGTIPVSTFSTFLSFLKTCWDSLLHVNAYLVTAFTLPWAFYFANHEQQSHQASRCCKKYDHVSSEPDYSSIGVLRVRKMSDYDPSTDPELTTNNNSLDQEQQPCPPTTNSVVSYKICSIIWTARVMPAFIVLLFTLLIVVTSQLHLVVPSIAWMPFAWGTYRVYQPHELQSALEGLCLTTKQQQQVLHNNNNQQQPLCLSESSWNTLSTGALSSKNTHDVATVQKGIEYAQTSGGMIINVMARDIVNEIEPLRLNVEALRQFFPKLSVVIFENDSIDGSREIFRDWANSASSSYTVDLMECEEAPDCKFGETHRYEEGFESIDYFKKSAVGSMVRFRQRMHDYILAAPQYKEYTHMMVMDMDLGISLSPLGVLHSLGKAPDNSVVSSGRMLFPGSLGSLTPPYDFSAFRPHVTESNRRVVEIHRNMFCALMPKGDKWRNQCDAVSSMQLMEVLAGDRAGDDLYRVDSAFNGAVLYPLKDLRESGTIYDWGDDRQRCEHIGFNLGLKNTMYVNPKWDMHLKPSHPGGPSGVRAMKQVYRITVLPQLGIVMFIQNVGSLVAFVYSIMTLCMHVLYPLCILGMTPINNAIVSRRQTRRVDQLPLKRIGA